MPQLDALRAFAVVSVLFFHFIPKLDTSPLGWIGVRLFFVLSGFLITGILLRERDLVAARTEGSGFALRQFYVRRFLRIFPIYYLVLFTLAILNAGEVRDKFFWHLAYLGNVRFVLDGYFHDWTAHFWSLCIEEQFYLVWPALILFLPRRLTFPVLIVAVLAAPAYRVIALKNEFSGLAYEVLPVSSLDTLGMGALLAVLLNRPIEWSARRKGYAIVGWFGLISYVTLMVLDYNGKGSVFGDVIRDTMFALFAAGLIAHAAHGCSGWLRSLLEFKPLLYIGTISYGIYVYHELVTTGIDMYVVKKKLHLSMWLLVPLKFAGTFLLAAISWRIFEKPINNLKRFFPYDRSEVPGASNLAGIKPAAAPIADSSKG